MTTGHRARGSERSQGSWLPRLLPTPAAVTAQRWATSPPSGSGCGPFLNTRKPSGEEKCLKPLFFPLHHCQGLCPAHYRGSAETNGVFGSMEGAC